MKGRLMLGTALVGAALLCTVPSRGVAPPAGPAAPQASTRVAVFNLTYVIRSYRKFEAFQAELKSAVDIYQTKDAAWKKEGEALAKEAQDPDTAAERREQLQEKLKDLTRRIEDNKAQAQKALNKRQGEQLKALYSDVEKAAARLAERRGYDLILHYNDAIADAERDGEANISRKMQAGALMPIFIRRGVDVSEELAAALNGKAAALQARAAR